MVKSCTDAFLPDLESKREFVENGVVHLRNVIDAGWLEFIREAARQAQESPGPLAELIGAHSNWDNLFKGAPSELQIFQDFEISLRRADFKTIATESRAPSVVSALTGSPEVVFFYDHLIVKHAGTDKSIPWHQDLPYWKIRGKSIATVWIPLDAMAQSEGVAFVPGSHRWGAFQPRHFVDGSTYSGVEDLQPMPDVDEMLRDGRATAVQFAVQPGDVLVFDASIVHSSGGNPTTAPQRRLALRYGSGDSVYFDHGRETAVPSDAVCQLAGFKHGEPLSHAPTVFPVVWPPHHQGTTVNSAEPDLQTTES